MRLLRIFIMVLALTMCLDSYAQTEGLSGKEKREAKKLERKAKRQEKRDEREFKAIIEKVKAEESNQVRISDEPQQNVETVIVQEQETALEPVLESTPEPEVESEIEKTFISEPAYDIVEQTVQAPVDVEETETSETDVNIFAWVVWILVIYLVYKIIRWIFSLRCPHCKRFFATYVSAEENEGRTKWETEYNNGKSTRHYYYKYKVWRTCRHCGGRTFHYEERKG